MTFGISYSDDIAKAQQVLKKIASLPEVRKEKVLDLRKQITEGEYDLNERLDVAVDKVIEQLTA